jgi:flagellin
VSASVISATGLRFYSTGFGAEQFVTVKALQGTFAVTGGDTGSDTDFGRDATVRVNGVTATTNGLSARVQTSTLSVDLALSQSFGTSLSSTSFYVTGGGADFAISPTVGLTGLASLGIGSVSTSSLGDASTGFLQSLGSGQANSLASGNYSVAQRILRDAGTRVAELRGRLGAFQKNTLTTTQNSLAIALENTTAAESAIRDADFALETSALTRAQILVQSATNTLRLANSQPQQVLQLLQ